MERVNGRLGLNLLAIALAIGAAAFFFPSLASGLAIPGFVLAGIGLRHSLVVRRAADVRAAEESSERALHFGVASASLSGLLLMVALVAVVLAGRDYP